MSECKASKRKKRRERTKAHSSFSSLLRGVIDFSGVDKKKGEQKTSDSSLALGHLFPSILSRKTGMASAVGVESSSLLQAPRRLDVAMPAPTATIALNATAPVKEGVPTAASPPGDASTALKLADCIGRVSAALAELGATVEALKGKSERREVTWLDISARERVPRSTRRGVSERSRRH